MNLRYINKIHFIKTKENSIAISFDYYSEVHQTVIEKYILYYNMLDFKYCTKYYYEINSVWRDITDIIKNENLFP